MDVNLLALSIGLGLVVSLLFSELFGLAAGGLVVPGYMALHLTSPVDVFATLAAALITFFLVRVASTFVIVYGRRRTAAMILVGYVVGVFMNMGITAAIEALEGTAALPQPGDAVMLANAGRETLEAGVIGYIVPGLIAIWLDRQGIGPTLAALLTSAVVVRLILILAVPEDLLWFEAGSEPVSGYQESGGP